MNVRRLASFALDLLLAAAPWSSLLGLGVGRHSQGQVGDVGEAIALAGICAMATTVLLVTQAFLFARRGRTMGMACVGLVATSGSRGRALFLGVLVFVLPLGLASLLAPALEYGEDQLALLVAAPLASLALEFFPVLGPDARTLSDRMAGVFWTHQARPIAWAQQVAAPAASKRGVWVDGLVLLMVSSPLLVLLLGWEDGKGAAGATAIMVALFVALEATVVARNHRTIAMGALAPRPAEGGLRVPSF
jgi:hypothetical protein